MATNETAMVGDDSYGQHLQWSKIGSTAGDIQNSLMELYWIGVKRDVHDIILTLRTWRGEGYRDVHLNEDQLCVGQDKNTSFGLGTFLSRASSMERGDDLSVI